MTDMLSIGVCRVARILTGWVLAVTVASASADYELMWAEEFDGPSIDRSTWTLDCYHGVVRSADDAGYYTDRPANVDVADGVLTIVARRESFDLADFTTARLHTWGKQAFTFGRFSVRMKLPAAAGLRPEVSLLPVELTYGSWPASGEITLTGATDGELMTALHFGGSGPRGTHVTARYPEDASTGDGFHVYTVEWQPHEIRWFVDDVLVAMHSSWFSAAAPHPAPFDRPFYLALGLAVDGGAERVSAWPCTMEIDWIRVYQAAGNRSPTVALTAPAPGAEWPAMTAIPLRAEATDPDGDPVEVEFYGDDVLLAVAHAAPFAFDWLPPDGCYVVAARAVDGDGFGRVDSADITVGRGCPPTPFHGVPAAIPGRIEAEDFDRSRTGAAYFDTDAANHGGVYRPRSGVDIQPCSDGGFNLAWMIDDEWTRYTVAVAADGRYDLRVRVASPNDTARIRLEIDGRSISGSLAIPNTGDWQRYTDVRVSGVPLTAGPHILRMVVEQDGLNLDYIEFTPAGE